MADRSSPSDRSLVLFLERRQMTVYQDGDAPAFIAELRRRWDKIHPRPSGRTPAPVLGPARTEFIFISYAHEDRQVAQAMRDALEAAGIDVWMDEGELEPGDEFKRKILLNIEKCAFFLPLITRNAAITRRRFLYKEWRKAADEREFRPPGYPFIQPILSDDTPENAVPPDFRDVTYQRLENDHLPTAFIEMTLRRIGELEGGHE